jgi:uncharacterized protein YdaU (DUF1376 family)
MDSRTYVKVNDGLPEHRKIVAVGGDAAWLYICGIAYCSRNLTDGLIPKGVVPRLSDRKQPAKLVAKLTRARLWHDAGHDCKRCPQPDEDEYVVHDYLVHQRSAEHIEAIKEKRAKAGRAGGSKKAANARAAATDAETSDRGQQTPSNLLEAGYDGVVANTTPEAVTEEVLRTSQADADTPPPNPLLGAGPSATAEPQTGEGEEIPEFELIRQVRELRPDWTTASITRALSSPAVLERPAALRGPALLAVARDRQSQQPGRLAHNGPWWTATVKPTADHHPSSRSLAEALAAARGES